MSNDDVLAAWFTEDDGDDGSASDGVWTPRYGAPGGDGSPGPDSWGDGEGAGGWTRRHAGATADDDPEASPLRRRIGVVTGLAAIVWTVVALLSFAGDDEGRSIVVPAGSETIPETGPSGTGPTGSDPAQAASVGPAAIAPDPVDAAAVVAVHDLVTGDGSARWVDAAAVESRISLPADGSGPDSPGATIAVVRALLLEGDADGWDGRRHARYAIAVECTAAVCDAVSPPWPLPLDPVAVASTDGGSSAESPAGGGSTTEDSGSDGGRLVAAEVRALEQAGYGAPVVRATRPLPGGVRELQVLAVPPGGGEQEHITVWVHGDADQRVVGMP